jgi:hypothetical protein
MYCRMDEASEIWVDFRKGSDRMLELQKKGESQRRADVFGCCAVLGWAVATHVVIANY